MHFTSKSGQITREANAWNLVDALKVFSSITVLLLLLNIVLYFADIKKNQNPGTLFVTVFLLVQHSLFIIPVYFFIVRKYNLKISSFGFRNLPIKTLTIWVLKGIGAFIITGIFLSEILNKYNIPGFSEQTPYLPLFGDNLIDKIFAIILLVLVSPIVEEFFFRGFVLQTLLSKMKPWMASIISALLFAAIHLEFQSIGIIFLLALIINWLYIRTKSVYPAILFHIINNAIAFAVEAYIKVN